MRAPVRLEALGRGVGVLTVVLLAGCWAGSTSAWAVRKTTTPKNTTTSTASTTANSSGPAPVYQVRSRVLPKLGKVLVDGQGFTLYIFVPDKRSGRSTCYKECAQAWPPLLLPRGVDTPSAGPGVRAALLATTKRKDGTVQVTYDKWPLYTWVIDSAPGQATGQDLNNLGGKWYVLSPDGKPITTRR